MPEHQDGGQACPSAWPPAHGGGHHDGAVQPGAAAWPSGRERQLFPLPLFAIPPPLPHSSRVVQQRRYRIRRAFGNCNEVVRALNWMAGKSDRDESLANASPMQLQALSRVEGLVFDQKPSGDLATPEEALRSLLHGGSPYDWVPSNETLASYDPELLSIPSDVSGCPPLRDVLPESDCHYLEEKSELMLSAEFEQEASVRPYWDPKLRFNKKVYNDLVRRLDGIHYFMYTTQPACKVGVFFVWKSSRTRLRMITDARLSNLKFKAAPGVSLMSSESFGRIEVAFENGVFADPEEIDRLVTYLGLSDVKDCFHRMRVPMWLARYFAWEPVPAKVVNLENSYVDGKFVGPLDPVWPCAGSLCQGFSWSLYFAQKANERVSHSCSLLSEARLLHDRGPPLVLRACSEGQGISHFYVYVDNLGVFGLESGSIEQAMRELTEKFNGLGLELHASEVKSGSVEALGCAVDGDKLRSRITSARLWKVHQSICGIFAPGPVLRQGFGGVGGASHFLWPNEPELPLYLAQCVFVYSEVLPVCGEALGQCYFRA